MKKILLICCFSILFTCAFTQERTTFADQGYTSDQILQGLNGSSTFFLRTNPNFDVTGSMLRIYYEPSQILDLQNSSISVAIGGKPVYSTKLQRDSAAVLNIPLSSDYIEPGSPFLRIQINAYLNITDDRCRDIDNPGLWLKLKPASMVIWSGRKVINKMPLNRSLDEKTTIVYPSNPSPESVQAVGWIYSILKKKSLRPIKLLNYSNVSGPLTNAIVVGNINELPASMAGMISVKLQDKQGLIYNYRRPDAIGTDSLNQADRVLFITGNGPEGFKKAINVLKNDNLLNSAFGNYLVVHKVREPEAHQKNRRLTLLQLGGTGSAMQGSGTLRTSYNFRSNDFDETPNSLNLQISGTYSSLKASDVGYLNVYLNDVIVSSKRLDETGVVSITATAERYLLKKYNSLVVEFKFYPATGFCSTPGISFTASLDDEKSFVETRTAVNDKHLSFYRFPDAFQHGKTAIVISPSMLDKSVKAVAELIYQINDNTNALLKIIPEIQTTDKVNDTFLKDKNVIALLDKNDPLIKTWKNKPVQTERNFSIYTGTNSKAVYQVSGQSQDDEISQIFFNDHGKAILLITGGKNQQGDFFNAVQTFTDQPSTLESNVAITSGEDHYMFNLTKDSNSLFYEGQQANAFASFWKKYNLYVLTLVVILILMAFFYVRAKVSQSQNIVNRD